MSLFTDRPHAGQEPSSFVASILVHAAVVGLLSYGLIHTPQISDHAITKRYAVRHLELHAKEPANPPSGVKSNRDSGAQSSTDTPQPENQSGAEASASWQIPQFAAALQTLVQPDLPPNLALSKETPTPTIVIWTPKRALSKTIVPPPPQNPASANAKPSLDAPNEELTLADLSVASVDQVEPLPLLAPSTTSPVMVQGPDPLQMAPTITSESPAQPASASALSLSDLRMPEGTVTLPPANETSPSTSPATQAPGLSANSTQTGDENHGNKSGNAAAAESKGDRAAASMGLHGAAALGKPNSESAPGDDSGNQPAADHITLPKNGQFGIVVVGSSLDEEYPELLQIWSGRIAYTAYLQVGKSRNWILQYSLPRSANTAAEGSIAPLEAPWPYEIVKPHLIPALLNADAMVLHGLVNSAGRFESMAIVYPARTPQGTLVLNSLAQWQFRPAKQNGNATAVEVVLVIPNEPE